MPAKFISKTQKKRLACQLLASYTRRDQIFFHMMSILSKFTKYIRALAKACKLDIYVSVIFKLRCSTVSNMNQHHVNVKYSSEIIHKCFVLITRMSSNYACRCLELTLSIPCPSAVYVYEGKRSITYGQNSVSWAAPTAKAQVA